MRIRPLILCCAMTVLVAGCAQTPVPIPLTPPAEQDDAAVVRRPLPAPALPAPPPAASAERAPVAVPPIASLPPTAAASLPPIVVPSDAIYVCVVDRGGTRRQTVIEFVPKVDRLCRRHPEMGPCQYERNICRAAGGRVFAHKGQEITVATEAEYDRKVLRVRFRSN